MSDTYTYMQHSFLAGELSPELIARVDIEAYQRGASELYNTFVDYKGGALNRAGTEWVFVSPTENQGYVTDEEGFWPRLVPFVYEDNQSLMLVFNSRGMYVIQDGAPVLNEVRNITGITKASPAVVTVSVGFTAVDDSKYYYLQSAGGMTALNNRFYQGGETVTPGEIEVELWDPFVDEAIDTTAFPNYTSGGTLSEVYYLPLTQIDIAYVAADLWAMKFIQSRDTLILVSPYYPPKLLTRVANNNWTCSDITYESSTVAPTGLSLNASFAGSGTEYSYVVTATDKDTGVESEASTEATSDLSYWPTTTDNIRVDWSSVTGASYYTIYKAPVSPGRAIPSGALYGQIGQARGTRFIDDQIAPNFALTPPRERNPFDATNKYPSCVAFIQQRVAYAATINRPYRVWTTPVGDFTSMNLSLPPRDSDALSFELASQRADPIKNLLAMPGGLLAFTAEAVYHIYGGGDGSPLTPSNINSDPVSYFGASNLAPIAVGYHILYSQNEGALIRDLQYNFFASSYDSTDITILAAHLFQGHAIMRWAFSNNPWKVLWAVRDDGRLISLTYVPENNVFAYALHETDGFVKDVCVIPEGEEDVVYLVVCRSYKDSIGAPLNDHGLAGYYTASIERMKSRQVKTITDAWFLDSAVASDLTAGVGPIFIAAATGDSVAVEDIDGSNSFSASVVGRIIRAGGGMLQITAKADANNITVQVLSPITDLDTNGVPMIQGPGTWFMNAKFTTFTGLWHLEDREDIWALADGGVQGPFTVTNGSITLTDSASYVVAGILYESRVKSLRIELETQGGTIQAQRKDIPAVSVRMYKSRGVEFGQSYDEMYSWPSRSYEPYGQPPDLITGDERVILSGGWNQEGQVCIRQRYPLPMQILGLIPEVVLGDT